MSKIKSLILGSAAGLVAVAGAQAADLPVKAKAVQYVKICSLYGAGFYYIPGTDTCLKVGGYAQFDVGIHGGVYDNPFFNGGSGYQSRNRDDFTTRTRFDLLLDARTATEYGVVRAYNDTKFQWTNGVDSVAGGSIEVDNIFVQFAGFTLGKAASAYSTPWHSVGGNNNSSSLIGGFDNLTGTPQISYTWQFGNGLSAQLGVEDPSGSAVQANSVANTFGYDRAFVLNANNLGATLTTLATQGFTNSVGGNVYPDVNGNIRLDQAAYTLQLSGALHDNHATTYTNFPFAGTTEINGHPSDQFGYAFQGGIQLKNLPTGPGDKFTIDGSFAHGANRYIIGGTTQNAFSLIGSANNPGSYQGIATAVSADAIYGSGGTLQLTNVYGVRGGFVHNWSPTWESDVFGSYSRVNYNDQATLLFCAGIAGVGVKSNNYSCNPDFSIYQIGTRLGWTPVQNLTFSAEVMYTYLDQNYTGSTTAIPNALKPNQVTGVPYDYKDIGTVSGNLRVRRTF